MSNKSDRENSVRRDGDFLVLRLNVSDVTRAASATTKGGTNKKLADSWSFVGAKRGWIDCGDGIALSFCCVAKPKAAAAAVDETLQQALANMTPGQVSKLLKALQGSK